MSRISLQRRLTRRPVLIVIAVAVVATAAVLGRNLLRNGNTYVPGTSVDGVTRELDRDAARESNLIFEDRTRAAGLDTVHFGGGIRSSQLPEDMGSGAAWGDYDNDGDPDLYLVDFAGPLTDAAPTGNGNRLYRNNGDGSFTDVTVESGTGWQGRGLGALWFDADGDGHDDLYLTAFGTNTLYHNDGDGTFSDHTESSGLGGIPGFWTGIAAADADGDGWLDLYVCGYVDYDADANDAAGTSSRYGGDMPFTLNPSSFRATPNLFYRNLGDGRFEELAAEIGVSNSEGRSLGVLWSDFNDDGWPDLYVANDVSDNVLFLNDGSGFFEDGSHAAGVADYRGAMGLATGDVDGDGRRDLMVTHWMAQENALYRHSNDTPLRFQDSADRFGLGQSSLDDVGWGVALTDFDGDGDPDLFIANGSTVQQLDQPLLLVPFLDRLFENLGGTEGFHDVPKILAGSATSPANGRSVAVADWDRDLAPDLVVTRNGGPPLLLRNATPAVEWMVLTVEQDGANPRAIGARIQVESETGALSAEVQAGGSYLGQSFPEFAFPHDRDAVVTVRWPGGPTETFPTPGTPGRQSLRRGEGS